MYESTSSHNHVPLVGRSRERVFLQEALGQAATGHGQVVLVGGEAGIGKTTLVRDLLREASPEKFQLLVSQCYDLTTTPPYGSWLDLFAHVSGKSTSASVPSAFVDGRLGRISDQARLANDVREFVRAASGVKPLLILFEDLHWADPASLDLLRYLAPRIRTMRVLLLLTYRDDEATRSNPFYGHLPKLLREADGLRLDLRRLTDSEIGELVHRRWKLSPAQENQLVKYVVGHAEGNPFFATELLRGFEDEGLVREWELSEKPLDTEQLVLPSLLKQVIDNRVAKLGSDTREYIALASVIGQEVPIALWAQVAELSEPDVIELIERAVDANVMEAGRSGTEVMFVHALTRSALYDGILPPRRRLLHQQIAEALIDSGSSNLDAIAHHLVQAGDVRAPDWLIRAGDSAQRSYAWLSAGVRFKEAALLLEKAGHSEDTRGWLLYRLARLQRYRGGRDALAAFTEAQRIGQRTGDRLLETDALYSLGVFQAFSGDYGSGVENIVAGIESMEAQLDSISFGHDDRIPWMADSLPSVRNEALTANDAGVERLSRSGMHHRRGGIPLFLAHAGRFDEATRVANQFLDAAGESSELGNWVISAKGHCLFGAAISQAHKGDPDGAKTYFEAGRALYASLEHHAVMAFSLLSELRESAIPFSTRNLGYRRQLGLEAGEALRRASGSFPEGLSSERAMLAIHYLDGNWAEASAIATDTSNHGPALLRREVVLTMAAIARAQGRYGDAWAMVDQALPSGKDTVPGSTLFPESTEMMMIATEIALDQGEIAEARAWLERYDTWMAWSHSVKGLAQSQVRWAQIQRLDGSNAEATILLRKAVLGASSPEQPLVLIEANRILGEFAAESGDYELAFSYLTKSLDLATACQIPYEQTLSRLALIPVLIENGMRERAVQLCDQVTAMVNKLELAPLRSRLSTVKSRLSSSQNTSLNGLTPRELEVLQLVALGMTDAAVGEKLFISPRTVSQHLRSIYAKLDVPSRSAATRYVIEHDLA